ncbi:MAG TPA: hypothetical protein VNN55_03195 [bacterium]|nr:hypothetical protein [bacterium]
MRQTLVRTWGALTVAAALAACAEIEDRRPLTDGLTIAVPTVHYHDRSAWGFDAYPVIELQAKEWYPNPCYYLEASVATKDNKIVISIGDAVYRDGICADVLTRAAAIVAIDTTRGRYQLSVVHGDSADHYGLNIYADRIQLTPIATRFTEPTDSVWWKVPRHSFAVSCQYSEHQYAPLCALIHDSVFGQPWLAPRERPQYGVWPYPPNADVYIYRDESDFATITRLLDGFPRAPIGQPAAVRIDIHNWRDRWYTARLQAE